MANETKLNMTLLLRRAAFADSCVLEAGEPGCFLDLNTDGSLKANSQNYTFKVGDGKTAWKDLPIANASQIQAMIDATASEDFKNYYTKTEVDNIKTALEGAINELDGELAAEVTARTQADAALQTAVNSKLATTTYEAHLVGHAKTAAEITTEIGDAVKTEKEAREAADKTITDTLGDGFDTSNNTVAKKIAAAEAAAKSHAETEASAAQSAAIAEAESKDVARAQAAATALSEAKTELEGKISSGDATTLASAKKYTDDQLDGRLDTVEAKLTNVSNVMDFVGARTVTISEEGVISVTANEGDTFNKGDVVVATSGEHAGKEFVFDGTTWHEFGYADSNTASINDLKERMDAAEEDIGENASAITALGTNKLDAQTFTDWKATHEADHADKQTTITSAINTAKQGAYDDAVAEAARLDGVLKTELQAEIDSDVAAAIAAEVTRSDAKAKELADAAQSAAEATAEAKDAARYTTVTTDIATAKSEAIGDAKDYTDAREIEIKKYADQAEADAIAAAKEYTDDQDVATLTAAKAYADEKVAGAVTKVTAGNSDIVVTPVSGIGDVTVAHKEYGTGTYTKPDAVSDTNFVTGVTIENGHVTGASVKSLAEALAAMTFIFDGGTSAN